MGAMLRKTSAGRGRGKESGEENGPDPLLLNLSYWIVNDTVDINLSASATLYKDHQRGVSVPHIFKILDNLERGLKIYKG
jgi:hypothetical protein